MKIGDAPRWLSVISYPTRARGIIVEYCMATRLSQRKGSNSVISFYSNWSGCLCLFHLVLSYQAVPAQQQRTVGKIVGWGKGGGEGGRVISKILDLTVVKTR